MIKLIATDMDGTFLNDNHEIDSEFWNVFEKLKKKDIKFLIASGRQYYNLLDRFCDIKDDVIFICENGAYVMYQDKELLSSCLAKEHVDYCLQKTSNISNIGVVVCGKKSAYITNTSSEFLEEVKKYYGRYEIVRKFSEIKEDIIKIAIYDFINSSTNTYPYFKDDTKDFKVVVSALHWSDIMNIETNKGNAIKKVQDIFGVTYDETMIFGDYLNDLEMTTEGAYSFAMGNAHPHIKKVAKFITKSNNEWGVTYEMKKYFNIE